MQKVLSSIVSFLNSDFIHKSRKAVVAGAGAGFGYLVTRGQSGPITKADYAAAIGVGVGAFVLVWLVPNRA